MRPEGGTLIEWLGSAEGDGVALGGKAASLDRLARMGFRIPPGFCVTTAAFRAQLSAIPGVTDALGGLASADGSGAGSTIAALVMSTPLGDTLREELATAIDRLARSAPHAPGIAVRSSAIGEDGADASYAGLHETELGVPPDGVEAAVRRCWASLWSEPALAYRRRRSLPLDGAAMGVVVQALVPADAAVVAFTRHPVTGREDQLVVTAVRGLGDAMVAGTVTPDTFVLERDSLAQIAYTPGDSGGGPALAPGVLHELAELCLTVERGFGVPLDIEAAVHNGTWYLLQARPITTH